MFEEDKIKTEQQKTIWYIVLGAIVLWIFVYMILSSIK